MVCPQTLKSDCWIVNPTPNVFKKGAFVFFILIAYIHLEMSWENITKTPRIKKKTKTTYQTKAKPLQCPAGKWCSGEALRACLDLTPSPNLSKDGDVESALLHGGWICLPLYLSHLLLNVVRWTKSWNLQGSVHAHRNSRRLISPRYLTLNLAYCDGLLCHHNEISFSFTACTLLIQTDKSFGIILCSTMP